MVGFHLFEFYILKLENNCNQNLNKTSEVMKDCGGKNFTKRRIVDRPKMKKEKRKK
jgi:hypothetical protein